MTPYDDPELAGILEGDPELLDMARLARSRQIDVPVHPEYQGMLRARLMEEAEQRLRPRGLRRLLLRHRTGLVAAFATGAGAVMIAVVAVALTWHGHDEVRILSAASPLDGRTQVDPGTNAITIAFNQPMDEASVVRAIDVEPATSYTTSWSGNTLTIRPAHKLSANTAYVVRIDSSVAKSTSGATPPRPIVVAFGTHPDVTPQVPTPAPTPQSPPLLAARTVGHASGDATIAPTGDGGILVTDVPTPAPAPSPTATPAPTNVPATPGATPTGTPLPTGLTVQPAATPTPRPAPSGLVHIAPDGTPAAVGTAATAAAVSPSGRSLAAIVPSDGGADLVISGLDGSGRRVLASADPGSPLAWHGGLSVLFVGGGRLRSVDLEGAVRTIAAVPAGARVLLAPGGRLAYVAPTAGSASPSPSPAGTAAAGPARGRLVDVDSGASALLPGSSALVAFSADGAAVAWTDASSRVDLLRLPAPLTDGQTLVPTSTLRLGAGRSATDLAVDGTASRVAVATATASGSDLRVLDAAGRVLARADGAASHPTLLSGGALAWIAGDRVLLATLPTTETTRPAAPSVPPEASALLDRLVAAQVSDRGRLGSIPSATPGLDLAGQTPARVTQGYVIAAELGQDGSTVVGHVRLVALPVAGTGDPVTFADETVTLARTDTGFAVAALAVTPPTPEPVGPHVLHVDTQQTDSALTVTVTFDSDLDPASVQRAVGLVGPDGTRLAATTVYDDSAKTATVTLPLTAGTEAAPRAQLRIDTNLRDVDGHQLAQTSLTPLGP